MLFRIGDLTEFDIDKENNLIKVTSTFLKPVHIVMASALKVYRGVNIEFADLEKDYYASNMLYHAPLEIDTIDGEHHAKAIKLRDRWENDEQVNKVMTIIRNNSSFDHEMLDTISVIISELFQNFYAHAEDNEPPICCLQDWSTSSFMEVAIADKGIGIAKSLENMLAQHPDVTNPCRFACENEVSSKLGKGHSGYGLYFTKRFVEENKGHLFLLSGQNCYHNHAGVESDRLMDYCWHGTVIRLIINKNRLISSEEFFRQIKMEQEGENYDEFF